MGYEPLDTYILSRISGIIVCPKCKSNRLYIGQVDEYCDIPALFCGSSLCDFRAAIPIVPLCEIKI